MSGSKSLSKAPEASTSSAAPTLGLNNLRFHEILGQGSQGKVWFARAIGNNTPCAVKVVTRSTMIGDDGLTNFEREVDCMNRVDRDFPYLIQMITHFTTPKFDFLVMEYHGFGDLKSIFDSKKKAMPENCARFYFAELACAVQHLHDRGIIHRDIKLENIVMGADGHLRLIDLGIGKVMTTKTMGTQAGTIYTMAPEILLNERYDFRADWYSLGIVLYWMLTRHQVMYECDDGWGKNEKYLWGVIKFPTEITEDPLDFLKRLLERDPRDRLANFQDVLRHKWFKGFTPESVLLQHRQPKLIPGCKEAFKLSNFNLNHEALEAKEYRNTPESVQPPLLTGRPTKRKTPPEIITPPKKKVRPETTTPPDTPP